MPARAASSGAAATRSFRSTRRACAARTLAARSATAARCASTASARLARSPATAWSAATASCVSAADEGAADEGAADVASNGRGGRHARDMASRTSAARGGWRTIGGSAKDGAASRAGPVEAPPGPGSGAPVRAPEVEPGGRPGASGRPNPAGFASAPRRSARSRQNRTSSSCGCAASRGASAESAIVRGRGKNAPGVPRAPAPGMPRGGGGARDPRTTRPARASRHCGASRPRPRRVPGRVASQKKIQTLAPQLITLRSCQIFPSALGTGRKSSRRFAEPAFRSSNVGADVHRVATDHDSPPGPWDGCSIER